MTKTRDIVDHEIEIVVWAMQRFQRGTPEHRRIQTVWHEAAFSGVLRGELPHDHEAIRARWNGMVAEVRRRAQ